MDNVAKLLPQEDPLQELEAPYQLRRLGVVMRPEPGNALEAGGVLNPGGVRANDGSFMLFPRLVAAGNYSRVGIARVIRDTAGVPCAVERLGIALEPEQSYEKNALTGGGCEDPRVVYVRALGRYVMTYVAYGPTGPRAAMAVSTDLMSWTRLGLIDFTPMQGADMNSYANKDHMLFPDLVPGPDGRPALALLHRPMYEAWDAAVLGKYGAMATPPGVRDRRFSMWISYCPLEQADWAAPSAARRPQFGDHHLLIRPKHRWEASRLGGGTPPVRLAQGWFTIYHGVEVIRRKGMALSRRYNAGALLLDPLDPRHVLYRSVRPTLEPTAPEERIGVVPNVVFPTAVDQYISHLDVYYGMADDCIGVARMEV